MRTLQFTVSRQYTGMTVKAFARAYCHLSVKFIRSVKFIPGGITVNGENVNTRHILQEGDLMEVMVPQKGSGRVIASPGPVQILYENDDVIAVNKQAGEAVHPSRGHWDDTLINHLTFLYQQWGDPVRLRLIGRLDKDTSGLLLVAKNRCSAAWLQGARDRGEMEHFYLAIVHGSFAEAAAGDSLDLADEGWQTVSRPISPVADEDHHYTICEDGRPSVTHYRVLAGFRRSGQDFSLLRLKLETGRTHQIRVHMASLGHPLAGDRRYGSTFAGADRALLHSQTVRARLFGEEQIRTFTAPLPEDMLALLPGNIRDAFLL